MPDDFDTIVVGAGMAGCAAAIRLAQGGANVLLVERGAEPGTKNLSGGLLWG
ncbi:MAG TPA: FAD-dependent oxidoreductase, partial [Thermoplasmata archaeon]|nr:FAD-dependent oxidoreductase [Thermoplasmata archaeon]